MPNVIDFRAAAAKRAAKDRAKPLAQECEDQPYGVISFTDMGNGTSRMKLTGTYASHTQYGIYTIISGLMDLANKVVESGDMGHHSTGAINEPLAAGEHLPPRLMPTDFGGLQ